MGGAQGVVLNPCSNVVYVTLLLWFVLHMYSFSNNCGEPYII